MKYVKMQRGDEIADVADFELELWQAAGFEVIYADEQAVSQAEYQTEAETEAPSEPVKRRGRPRKLEG
jgi:hypothetical protein